MAHVWRWLRYAPSNFGFRPAAGRLYDRCGLLAAIYLGAGGSALGLLTLAAFGSAATLIIAAVLLGFGMGILLRGAVALAAEKAP